MTAEFQDRLIAHLVWVASLDKALAWSLAKNYATMGEDFADVPQLLTAAMNQK